MREQDFKQILALLNEVSERNVNENELRMILRRYPDVDTLLETQRFVQWWQTRTNGDKLASLRPYENSMNRARPMENRAGAAEGTPREDRWQGLEAKLRRNLVRARNSAAGRADDGRPLDTEEIENEVSYHRRRFFGVFS